ncbi:hypothetical protein [Nocardiopsis oceani]
MAPTKPRTPWPHVVSALALVLLAAWVLSPSSENGEEDVPERLLDFQSAWPTVTYEAEEDDDFLEEAVEQSCPEPDLCHILWADAGVEGRDNTAQHEAALVDIDPEEDELRLWTVRYRERSADGLDQGYNVRGPEEIDPNVPSVLVAENLDHNTSWLLPEGATGVETLSFDEDEGTVVTEDTDQRHGKGFERVHSPQDKRAENPVLRYQYRGQTTYRSENNVRVCVEEPTQGCRTTFPTEESLVSLNSALGRVNFPAYDNGPSIHLDPEVRFDGEFGGLVDEPLGDAGGVVWFSWVSPHYREEDKDEELSAHAVYFDNGAPAVQGVAVDRDELNARGSLPDDDAVDGVAMFRDLATDPDAETDPVVPVAFHPNTRPPVMAPELDVAESGDGFTIYEPVSVPEADEDPARSAYVFTDADGEPLWTGWVDPEDR